MKLIDLMVKELPKRGGWPNGCYAITQDSSKAINIYDSLDGLEINEHGFWCYLNSWIGYCITKKESPLLASDYDTAIITRAQYESALAASKETLTGIVVDDWIEWGGGECPVNGSEMVDVIFGRGGIMSTNIADCWRWNHSGTDSDIIAYRLHQPTKSEQVRADAWRSYAGITETDDESDLNECIGQGVDMPEWNGEGLPPVGAKVEFFINPKFGYRNDWIPDAGTEIEVVAHKTTTDGNDVAVCYWDEGGAGRSCCLVPESLKPLRTEAEKAREAAEAAMRTCLAGTGAGITPLAAKGIYDAIAAGKIPGVKLEGK